MQQLEYKVSDVIKLIKYLLSNDWSADILITGRRGTGKSGAAIRLCEVVDPTFNADRVVMGNKEYIEKYHGKEKISKGQAIVYDEVGVELGATKVMQRDVKDALDELMTNRVENTLAVFTTPSVKDPPDALKRKLTLWIHVTGRNNKFVFAYPKHINDRQLFGTYYSTMRTKGTKKRIKLHIHKPSEELWNNYKERKREYRESLGDKLQGKEGTRPLTPFQSEVFRLSLQGLKQKEIAELLNRSQQLVSQTLKQVRNKGYNIVLPNSINNKGGLVD